MLFCPACRASLVAIEFQDVEIDYCPGCHGCWLDRFELGLLLRGDPSADPGLELREGARTDRRCPRCGDRMREAALAEAEIVLDACRHGHGLWLDRGELQAVIGLVSESPTLAPLSDFCERVFGAAAT